MLFLGVVSLFGQNFNLFAEPESEEEALIDFYSIIQITFQKNMEIAASRFDIEASKYQFERFERNLSGFIPFIVETNADRDLESYKDGSHRLSDTEHEAAASVGFEKEFFDGKKISASSGVRMSSNGNGDNGHPFIGAEMKFPLFSSFTTLKRVTERSFEESELLSAWLDFIDTVRDSISDSHEAYVKVEEAAGINLLIDTAIEDLKTVLGSAIMIERENDRLQLEDEIQAYQTERVNVVGDVDASIIELMETLGLNEVTLDNLRRFGMVNDSDFYGRHYVESDLEWLTQEATENDVEIQVLNVARNNAELKKDLAKKGKWDILGKLSAEYDFAERGDDLRRKSGYQVGLGFSIQRNDPKLLLLSMRQAGAEINGFSAQIEWRERKVKHLIQRKVSQARSTMDLIVSLQRSRTLRQSVFAQKLKSYLVGDETIENLIKARDSLYKTEENIVERHADFYKTVIELDVASGFYFKQLGDLVETIGESYSSSRLGDSFRDS